MTGVGAEGFGTGGEPWETQSRRRFPYMCFSRLLKSERVLEAVLGTWTWLLLRF